MKLNVVLLDTKTNVRVTSAGTKFDDMDIWWWTEGNGGCDCNRAYLFADEVDEEMDSDMRKQFTELKPHQGYCYGEKRFLVVLVDPMPDGYSIRDFNDGYPDELIDKHAVEMASH